MSHTVLIVEDTELLRRMYSDRLVQDGFEVQTATDGLAALSLLRSATPDLILLDLIMPRMSGLEVLEVIKKDPRTAAIPVIILSNLAQDAEIARGIELGAIDYLVKNDARPADVAHKITTVLGLRGGQSSEPESFRLVIQDRAGDADRFIGHAALTRRLWCPACEVELNLELLPDPARAGWYGAHLICPMCGREY